MTTETQTNCPLCPATSLVWKQLVDDLVIGRCHTCSLLVRKPCAPTRRGSQYALIDETKFRNSIGVMRASQAIEIVRHASGLVRTGRWLDVGAGFGWLLREARSHGFAVEGLEPDARAAAAARIATDGATIHESTFEQFEVAESSLDILSTLDVFEHADAQNLKAFAAKVRRVLRPHGVWLIKVPSTDGLLFELTHRLLPVARSFFAPLVRRLWQHDEVSPHTVYFNVRSLARFLRDQGFEVILTRHMAEVTAGTGADRLAAVGTASQWPARLMAPLLGAVGLIERVRRRSDALFVIARAR